MPAYRLAVPPPWERIRISDDTDARIDQMVEAGMARLPKDVPPDQVGPVRRGLQHRLRTAVAEAAKNGALDIFVPADSWHGFHLGASFVIAQIAPPADPPPEVSEDKYVPAVMAQLLQSSDATRVSTADSEWVRRMNLRPGETAPGIDVPTVTVDYVTPTPDDLGTWTAVSYSTVGDGDPDSETTRLSVELFDAIMSTWIWVED